MSSDIQFPWQQEAIISHSQLLLKSYQHWTGNSLLDFSGSPIEIAKALFEVPFPVLSHGTEPDPIYNYGNRKALEFWEMDWENFTKMPSRYSAEPMEREERLRLLNQVTTKGYLNNYRGVRISSTGKRYMISNVTVWNILDQDNHHCGQAATFSQWTLIN